MEKQKKERKCKYCNKTAEMLGYRDNNGCVSKEAVCELCNYLTTEVLSLKSTPFLMEEGKDYWAIEKVDSDCPHLVFSCWDAESLVIGNKDIFTDFESGKKYLKAIGKEKIEHFDFRERDSEILIL